MAHSLVPIARNSTVNAPYRPIRKGVLCIGGCVRVDAGPGSIS